MREDVPLKIRKVFLKGNKRTKDSVFDSELQEAYEGETWAAVRDGLSSASRELLGLGIFESVHVNMDAAEGEGGCTDVTISVKEKDIMKLNVGTFITNGEGTLETSAVFRNALGLSESAELGYAQGRGGSSTASCNVRYPRILGQPAFLDVNLRKEDLVFETFSSYNERQEGGSVGVTDYAGRHKVEFVHLSRDIWPRMMPHNLDNFKPNAYYASHSVVQESGTSGKTGLRYSFTDDRRDSPTLPTSGSFLRLSAELAHVAQYGQVAQDQSDPKWADKLVKLEAAAQKFVPLQASMTLGLSGAAGVLWSGGKKSQICDRFFVGGPSSLRGFEYKGIGPRAPADQGGASGGDALGGDMFYTLGATLAFPFPHAVLAVRALPPTPPPHFPAHCHR